MNRRWLFLLVIIAVLVCVTALQARTRIGLRRAGVFANATQERAFNKLVGPHREAFEDCFQLISEAADLDGFGARVRSGGVRGLFTSMEGIIMVNDRGQVWAAVIDNQVVRYFTNVDEWRAKLPKTIEKWRERFASLKVIYMQNQAPVPGSPWRAGIYRLTRENQWDTGRLEIAEITATGFYFSLEATSGGHLGNIDGTAAVTGNRARFVARADGDTTDCTLDLTVDGEIVTVKQTSENSCSGFAGAGVTFEGQYKRLRERE